MDKQLLTKLIRGSCFRNSSFCITVHKPRCYYDNQYVMMSSLTNNSNKKMKNTKQWNIDYRMPRYN